MPRFDDEKEQAKLEELRQREEEGLIRTLSAKYGHQYVDLHGVTIDTDALRLISPEDARAGEIAVFGKTNRRLRVAIRNPNNAATQAALAALAARDFTVEIFMVSTASLEHAWTRYEDIKEAAASRRGVLDIATEEITRYREQLTTPQAIADALAELAARDTASTASAALEAILGGALAVEASDVHIEPEADAARLRLRLDGVLADVTDLPSELYTLLRSRLKLLSGLKLNISDRAQDGRFTIAAAGTELEIRASVIPGAYGESIVLRLLDPSTIGLAMEELGIGPRLFAILEEELARPNGMIITTGPTGSGKTTSLYAFLKRVHRPEIKVVTLEDPIEYHLEGIVQTQITEEYAFATGLRAILRQDPDVILVGEIRDRDVAETAINAALTGHLVFSTLHTNDAAGAFPRLIDLGVDARLIGSALNLTLAQRLVRRLCKHCRKERPATPEEATLFRTHLTGVDDAPVLTDTPLLYDPVGCEQCGGMGYRGRIGVYEGIRVDATVEAAVISDPRESHILEAAAPQNIPSMLQDGLMKVLTGTTSLIELGRVVDLHDTKRIPTKTATEDTQKPT